MMHHVNYAQQQAAVSINACMTCLMYVMFVDNPVDVVLHMVKREMSQIAWLQACKRHVDKILTSIMTPSAFRLFRSSWSMFVKFLAASSLTSCLCSSVLCITSRRFVDGFVTQHTNSASWQAQRPMLNKL